MTPVEWIALAALVLAAALAVPAYRRHAAAERVIARLREPPPRRRLVKPGAGQPGTGVSSIGISQAAITRSITGGYTAGGGYPSGGYPAGGYPGTGGYPGAGGYPGQTAARPVGGGYPASAGYPSQGGSMMRTMVVRPQAPPPEVQLEAGEVLRELPAPGSLRHALLQAGVEATHQRPAEVALLAAWALVVVGTWLVASGQWALLVLCAAGLSGRVAIDLAARGRRQRIINALPDAVDLVCGGLVTGYELPGALAFATTGTTGPMRVELRRMLGGIEAGLTPGEAVQRFARLVPAPGPRLVARAVQVAEEVGGSLAPSFRRVARTLRENARVEQRVGTTSAVGITSASFIFIMSWAVPVIFDAIYPGHLDYLLDTRRGQMLLAGALTLQALGAVWVEGLVRERRAA